MTGHSYLLGQTLEKIELWEEILKHFLYKTTTNLFFHKDL